MGVFRGSGRDPHSRLGHSGLSEDKRRGCMERFRKGWQLTKKSWGLLRENRDLIKFPLYGAVATILVALVTLGPGVYLLAESIPGAGIPLVVLGIYLASFVGVYFAVALAAAANLIFSGQPATV